MVLVYQIHRRWNDNLIPSIFHNVDCMIIFFYPSVTLNAINPSVDGMVMFYPFITLNVDGINISFHNAWKYRTISNISLKIAAPQKRKKIKFRLNCMFLFNFYFYSVGSSSVSSLPLVKLYHRE